MIDLITTLPESAPELVEAAGVKPSEFDMLLRAAVEGLRGTASATTNEKRRFVEAILDYGKEKGVFASWTFEGTRNRQDYRVDLADGTVVSIEAKGCPDGNNTTIWDRPGWAHEFVVWSLCPESLAHEPGHGIWSGLSTRLLPKLASEKQIVDAFIFWDGRCGSTMRPCAKQWGVTGALRGLATTIPGQEDRAWVPPPCIWLLPDAPPNVRNNRAPRVRSLDTSRFATALLTLFDVPASERPGYVHEAAVEVRGTAAGNQIRVSVTSRAWSDGQARLVQANWKPLRRE